MTSPTGSQGMIDARSPPTTSGSFGQQLNVNDKRVTPRLDRSPDISPSACSDRVYSQIYGVGDFAWHPGQCGESCQRIQR